MQGQIERYGIYETISHGGKIVDDRVSIFETKEEREKVWNQYTEYYRKKNNFTKCKVIIIPEED